MTTTATNAPTDIKARGRQMQNARTEAEGQVWRLKDRVRTFWASARRTPQEEISRAERREAARRAADNLLR